MLEAEGIASGEYLEYKERPLVRQDVDIYYGDLSDNYYIYMMIMSEVEKDNCTVPNKILVQLLDSNTKSPKEQKMLSSFKDAFEFADAWLERYNR
jgi:hypothetical protein